MTDIAYIISHGFAARMVLQTGLLREITNNGYKVCLVSPDSTDANLLNVAKGGGIKLVKFQIRSSFWNAQYQNLRTYILEDIRNNVALWEKHIESKRYKGRNLWYHIRPFLFYWIHKLVMSFPIFKRAFKRIEMNSLNSKEALNVLAEINPRILVSTYPVNLTEATLLHNAKRKGIQTIIHLLSWDNISCKGHFPALADKYIAWGPIMKEELMEYYCVPEDKIYVCGVPHFDLHHQSMMNPNYKDYLGQLGLNQDAPFLIFAMSAPRFSPNEIDVVERLATEVRKNTFGENMQLIVRPHPQNVAGNMADESWLPRLKSLDGKRVAVDFPALTSSRLPWSMKMEDMYRLSQLLLGAQVCINSGSTMSIDALMVDTPVVLSSFDGNDDLPFWNSAKRLVAFPHLKKFISLDGIQIAKSFEELFVAINHFRKDGSWLKNEREITRYQECGINDGQATQRVVRLLLEIVKTRDYS